MLENGTIIANRYEIIGKIGTGGTADVYKAKCHKLNRFVAIKVLKREFSEDRNFISKFRIEAQSAAGMAHANIVNVYDVGDENGIYYIVMELVEGITLKKYIEKKGALEYKEAVSIAIQIAQGIEAAHKHNIIHRDIKPQNIIISREGKVKVTDFGIAKVTNTDTVNSVAMGSVHYISPEQARGGFSDVTSDIYSFGITLYEMCTGRVPFDGESTVAVALMHIQNELPLPTLFNPTIPVSVEKIILKCAQKRVDQRYQSASDVIVDLKRALITPNEDFVTINNGLEGSPTVLFTQEEMDQINSTRRQDSYSSNPMNLNYTDSGNDGTGNSLDLMDVFQEERYEEHHTLEDEEEEEEDYPEYLGNRKVKDDNNIDRLMVWFGAGVAVIIVIVTIVVVMQMFNKVGNMNKPSTNPSTEATAPIVETVAQNQGVPVPDLRGMTQEDAQKALNALGLGFGTPIMEPSDLIQKGYVIAQNVEPNTHVAEHTKITVTVSSGPKTFAMIDVLNKKEEEAKSQLEELKLVVEVEYDYSEQYPQGFVMATNPIAGLAVKAGDKVTIKISRGSQQNVCIVPNILDMDESEARKALDDAGLVAQLAGTAASTTIEVGRVTAQSYPYGTRLARGSVVEYYISSGNSNKPYKGTFVLDKQMLLAKEAPEGFTEETGIREVQIVLRQSKDGKDENKEILEFTDVKTLADSYEINFAGLINGVPTGTLDIYIRYTWKDASGEEKKETQDVQSVIVNLAEVDN